MAAASLNRCAWMDSGRVRFPSASTLMRDDPLRISPFSSSTAGVISCRPSSRLRSRKLTTAHSTRKIFVKPRFGTRRFRGICPPSNPGRLPPPDRASRPLCPFVDVFPWPEPMPRPMRLRRFREFAAGFKSWSFIGAPFRRSPYTRAYESSPGLEPYRGGPPYGGCGEDRGLSRESGAIAECRSDSSLM